MTQSSVDLTRLSYRYAGNFASLLPFGVLILDSFRGLPGPAPIAPDGWNWAPPLPWQTSRRGTFERDLEFLSAHDFIRATYRMEGNGIAKLRIYVLPEDGEWCIVRDQSTEYKGRALLRELWNKVDTNPRSWRSKTPGKKHSHRHASLIVDDDLSLNLSAIYNTLPPPKPDSHITESAPPTVRYLLESVLDDDGVPGFRSQLYYYQRESIWKMLQRELVLQKLQDPRLRRWIGPTEALAWINTEDMTFFRKQRYIDDVRGGILCEEMGTGKTVFSSMECC
jgi:SNF2-related domain